MAAHALGASTVASLKVLAAVTLFELAVQQSGRRLAAAVTALALVVAANRFEDLPGELLPVLYKMGIVAGLPLLLGAYVRVTRDAAVHALDTRSRSSGPNNSAWSPYCEPRTGPVPAPAPWSSPEPCRRLWRRWWNTAARPA
ncbi:hypothetical protein [Streptomyces sp. NPDC093093]|uniref:hypothetical protein n=1 Tax=Streptomyces sp. NPDC093093 TaxID=3366025 RepID=UPI0037F886CF